MTEQPEWNYDRIYHKVSSYVLEGEPVRAVLLFDALAKREGRDVRTGLTPREWDWLQWNLGFLKKVVGNKLMSTMMFLARKSQSSSFNIREVARRTGYDESLAGRYARQLESQSLLRRHRMKFDRRVYYVLCQDLPIVSKMLMELIVVKYGLDFFEDFLKPSDKKANRHAQTLRAVNQRVQRHYKVRGRG